MNTKIEIDLVLSLCSFSIYRIWKWSKFLLNVVIFSQFLVKTKNHSTFALHKFSHETKKHKLRTKCIIQPQKFKDSVQSKCSHILISQTHQCLDLCFLKSLYHMYWKCNMEFNHYCKINWT